MTAPQPARPIAPAPIAQNIPAELAERPQWVVWRYELKRRKDGVEYWAKVPYTPHTLDRAASNRPASWRSFRAAVACYQERPDYFDGIGYMFLASDPYVGGDFDHCLHASQLSEFAQQHLPATYAEISPSGRRAQDQQGRAVWRWPVLHCDWPAARQLPSGHHRPAAGGRDALRGAGRVWRAARGSGGQRGGSTACGSRAELAASIPASEWALKKRSQVIASQAAEMYHKGDSRAPIWQHRAGIYAAEEARRGAAAEQADRARFGELGYCEQERQAMLELVEQARQLATPAPARAATIARASDAPAPAEPAMPSSAAGLIARLKARRNGQLSCA